LAQLRIALTGADPHRLSQVAAALHRQPLAQPASLVDLQPAALSNDALEDFDLVLLLGLEASATQAPPIQVIDQSIRTALLHRAGSWCVIYGAGPARQVAQVRAAVAGLRAVRPAQAETRWQHFCEACGDGDGERRTLHGLLAASRPAPNGFEMPCFE
jgi:hypothetical protein